MLTLADVVSAKERLAPYLQPTPLEYAPGLGERVYLKLENANLTHSFKIRGALNAMLSLSDGAKERGVVTASSGNHAQALAYAAKLTGIRARILMPNHTPARKVNGVRQFGADAVLFGDNFDQTEAEARRLEREEGLYFVSAYADPVVIAGAGTIGLEILEKQPDLKRLLVCVSGGGLISGIAMVVKSRKPDVEIIGVTGRSTPAMYNHFYGDKLPQVWDTLAEALSGGIEPGSITLDIAPKYVDKIALVDETQIASAMRWMVDTQGWMVEGGGAVCVAALLHEVVDPSDDLTVAVVSGGNVDGTTLRNVLLGLM